MVLSCPEPPLPPGHLCEPDLLLLGDDLKLRVQMVNEGLLLSLSRILGAYLYLTLLEVPSCSTASMGSGAGLSPRVR